VWEKCPQCGHYVIYDSFYHEYVCPQCGVVVCDKPLVYDSSRYDRREEAVHYSALREGVLKRDWWLLAGIEFIIEMRGVVFHDYCTQRTAIEILRDVYEKLGKKAWRLDYEDVSKYAVLVASRRCGEHVESTKLFKSLRDLYRLVRSHSYLREIYTPPRTSEQVVQDTMRILKCLEERGAIQDPSAVKRVVSELASKLPSTSIPPRHAAIILVHAAILHSNQKRIKLEQLAQCSNTTKMALQHILRRHYSKVVASIDASKHHYTKQT
jgi:TFIIB zinc-binding.